MEITGRLRAARCCSVDVLLRSLKGVVCYTKSLTIELRDIESINANLRASNSRWLNPQQILCRPTLSAPPLNAQFRWSPWLAQCENER